MAKDMRPNDVIALDTVRRDLDDAKEVLVEAAQCEGGTAEDAGPASVVITDARLGDTALRIRNTDPYAYLTDARRAYERRGEKVPEYLNAAIARAQARRHGSRPSSK